jgi:hypothetical protein
VGIVVGNRDGFVDGLKVGKVEGDAIVGVAEGAKVGSRLGWEDSKTGAGVGNFVLLFFL